MLVEVVVALGWGAALTMVAARLVRPILAAPVFRRQNYRGAELAVGSGLVIVVASLIAAAVGATIATLNVRSPSSTTSVFAFTAAATIPVIGFAFLGLIDDLAATGDARGFRGHIRSLAHGELTTGGLKLFGGACFALWWSWSVRDAERTWPLLWVLINGAIIALAANVGNLFDRAPGRTLKVSALSFVAILVSLAATDQWKTDFAYVAFLLGIVLVMLRADLQEVVMLGDTGANALGAVAGVATLHFSRLGRVNVLVFLLVLNLLSEKVSFSRVIDGWPPLRWLDRLGARAERKAR